MRITVCFLLLTAGSLGTGLAQTAPVRAVDSDCPSVTNQLVPMFRGGYCFKLDQSSVRVYAPGGQLAFAAVPQLPGGGDVSLLDVAVDPDGGFALLAANRSAQGLVLLDQNGDQRAFIPITGFYPTHLTIAEDRSIWILASTGRKKSGNQPVVYRYSASGQQTGSFLPISGFPAGTMDPGLGVIGAAPILAGGGVIAVIARSGAGSNLSNLRELIRMDYSGKTLSRTRLDNVQEQTFAMTGDGNLYRCDNLPGAPSYRFDPAAQNWQQIAKPSELAVLFGAEGTNLVYRFFDGSEKVRMQWYPEPAAAH